ncbi:hypothetical protein F5Y04DRAFT_280518 [Hypomontagnella monticulosa]|nr:hypothetical protein F5Y04DRAFT_280518 [Hypomontagnella monticulosa]
MYLPSPLVLLTTLLLTPVPQATARCFSGGEKWDSDQSTALENAKRACREGLASIYGNEGGSATRSRCYDVGSNRRAEYTVGRTVLGSPRTLGYDECFDGLRKEVEGCEHGGSSEYTNWFYT